MDNCSIRSNLPFGLVAHPHERQGDEGHSMTDESDLLGAYLENELFEQAEDYVKRGRVLAQVDDKELEQRWIACFKEWAACPYSKLRKPRNPGVFPAFRVLSRDSHGH